MDGGLGPRATGSKFDRDAHREAVRVAVPEQAMCEAIATTAKHAEHRDDKWLGGQVSLEWQEGDEDGPPGYILRHRNGGGRDEDLAVNNFEALCSNWWAFLRSLGLAQEVERIPQWHLNELHRIFGDPDDRILPPGCHRWNKTAAPRCLLPLSASLSRHGRLWRRRLVRPDGLDH